MAKRRSPRSGNRTRFPWIGRIANTWSAALRRRPEKDPANPHSGVVRDLPRNTRVEVRGIRRGWLHVAVVGTAPLVTGFVSHELVEYVAPVAPRTPAHPEPLVPLGYGSSRLVPRSVALAYRRRTEKQILEQAALQQQKSRLALTDDLRKHPKRHLTRDEYMLIWSGWHPHDELGYDVPSNACLRVNAHGVCHAYTREYALQLVREGKATHMAPYRPPHFEPLGVAGGTSSRRPKIGKKFQEDVLASAERKTGKRQLSQALRKLQRRQGDANGLGLFNNVSLTEEGAHGAVRDILSNATTQRFGRLKMSGFAGQRGIAIFDGSGRGILVRQSDGAFITFLEEARGLENVFR